VGFINQLGFHDSYGYGLRGFTITDKTFQTFGKRRGGAPKLEGRYTH